MYEYQEGGKTIAPEPWVGQTTVAAEPWVGQTTVAAEPWVGQAGVFIPLLFSGGE